MNWRMRLKKIHDLKSKGCSVLFDQVTEMVVLETDADWLADCEARQVEPLDELDGMLDHIGHDCPFGLLKQVLNHYPKQEQWQRSLSELIRLVVDRQKSERASEFGESGSRTSWKSIAEQRQREIERLERELQATNAKVEELRDLLKGQMTTV